MAHPLPEAFLARLKTQFGEGGVNTLLKAFAEKRKTTFRVNTLKATDAEVMDVLREEQVQFERVKEIPHAFAIKNRTDKELLEHPLTKEGKIYLQGISSMLPPIILDPKGGEHILDLCAAPGSKTSELAALSGNQAKIIAIEENDVRFLKLKNTLTIQGTQNVEARRADGTIISHEFANFFDKILADVPCSAEGRIDINDKRSFAYWSEKNIVAHAKLQRRLLRSAVECLKPGGTLVYSTCTLAPEENEQMVGWLLGEYPSMKAEEIKLPFATAKKTAHGGQVILPNNLMEGFFVAKLKKAL